MHLIWDWNGTLFDDLHIVVESVNASLATVGAGFEIDADGYRDNYRRPVRGFYAAMLGRPVSDADWERINRSFHDSYFELLPRAGPARDAHDAVADAARRRLSQSILSMWTHDLLVPTVARYGLGELMVSVRGSESSDGDRKIDLLRRHLGEVGSAGNDRVVLIGDTFDDAAAAHEVGALAVFYDGGSHHRHELEETGVPVADSLLAAIDLAAQM